MIKKIKYFILGLAIILFLFSLKVGFYGLTIRHTINDIASRENRNTTLPDSLMIKRIKLTLTNKNIDSLKNQVFYFHDLKTAILELWKSEGIGFYYNKIVSGKSTTSIVFVGYYPDKAERKYTTITIDSFNRCTLIKIQ